MIKVDQAPGMFRGSERERYQLIQRLNRIAIKATGAPVLTVNARSFERGKESVLVFAQKYRGIRKLQAEGMRLLREAHNMNMGAKAMKEAMLKERRHG